MRFIHLVPRRWLISGDTIRFWRVILIIRLPLLNHSLIRCFVTGVMRWPCRRHSLAVPCTIHWLILVWLVTSRLNGCQPSLRGRGNESSALPANQIEAVWIRIGLVWSSDCLHRGPSPRWFHRSLPSSAISPSLRFIPRHGGCISFWIIDLLYFLIGKWLVWLLFRWVWLTGFVARFTSPILHHRYKVAGVGFFVVVVVVVVVVVRLCLGGGEYMNLLLLLFNGYVIDVWGFWKRAICFCDDCEF